MKTTTTILILFIFCSSICGQNLKDSLLVFIGEKIVVKYSFEEKKEQLALVVKGKDSVYVKQHSIGMDSRYIANYKILKLLNGSYINDTIEFEVFDHYGEPRFAKFETVLLFVSKKTANYTMKSINILTYIQQKTGDGQVDIQVRTTITHLKRILQLNLRKFHSQKKFHFQLIN